MKRKANLKHFVTSYWVSYPPLRDCVTIDFCLCEREIVGRVTLRGEANIAGSGDPAYIAFPPFDIVTQSLCGIVQLTNSAALRFRNWSFNNERQ